MPISWIVNLSARSLLNRRLTVMLTVFAISVSVITMLKVVLQIQFLAQTLSLVLAVDLSSYYSTPFFVLAMLQIIFLGKAIVIFRVARM